MREALKEQDGRCFYCKAPLSEARATIDHRIALAKGGGNARENIAAACAPCNEAKADLDEGWFFRHLTKKTPPKIGGSDLLLIWATRRIWRRTNKACNRIERVTRFVASESVEASKTQQGENEPVV